MDFRDTGQGADDMTAMMTDMLEKVATDSNGSSAVQVGAHTIEFKAPYPRVPILEAIKIHTGYDVSGMKEEELKEVCRKFSSTFSLF